MNQSGKGTVFSVAKKSFLFLSILLLLTAFFYGNVSAQDKTESLLARVQQLESRLKQIETDQAAILEKQDQIIEDLKVLRVWVRRN